MLEVYEISTAATWKSREQVGLHPMAGTGSCDRVICMRRNWVLTASLAAVGLLVGCQTFPPGAERGPQGTMAYDVIIEASEPGARIEANGESIGNTPVHLKIFGDTDGTFHDFGSYQYGIRALPLTTNQFSQVKVFGTGRFFSREDLIPQHVVFDMNVRPPVYAPVGPLEYPYPVYAPPPFYYGPSYYRPGIRFYFGPDRHRRW